MNDMIIQLLSRGTSMDKLALMFMKRAEGDLKSAEVLFDAERYADTAYHSQQAAEKAVKSLLLLNKIDVREHLISSHFVRNISPLLPPEKDQLIKDIVESLALLEQHWIKPRYPYITSRFEWDPEKEYTKDKAQDALEKARNILLNMKNLAKELFAVEFQ